MATYDGRLKTGIIDTNLRFADGATCPGAIASAGSTSVTSTNLVDMQATNFRPNYPPKINIVFPASLPLTSAETVEVRIQDSATSGGTYTTRWMQDLNNETISSGDALSVGISNSLRYLRVQLYLSNTAGTSDLSSYTYTAYIDPLVT